MGRVGLDFQQVLASPYDSEADQVFDVIFTTVIEIVRIRLNLVYELLPAAS
jgi:hypothetical protein